MCVHPHTHLPHTFVICTGHLPAVLHGTRTSSFANLLSLTCLLTQCSLRCMASPWTCKHSSLFAAHHHLWSCPAVLAWDSAVMAVHTLWHSDMGFPMQLLDRVSSSCGSSAIAPCSPCYWEALVVLVMMHIPAVLWIMHAHEHMVWSGSRGHDSQLKCMVHFYAGARDVLLMKLWATVFPVSDKRHPVTTPLVLLTTSYLALCPVTCHRDAAIGKTSIVQNASCWLAWKTESWKCAWCMMHLQAMLYLCHKLLACRVFPVHQHFGLKTVCSPGTARPASLLCSTSQVAAHN